MSDPLIRECDHYVVIDGSMQEKFLNQAETIEWIKSWLDHLEKLPDDLQNQPSTTAAAKRLLDTACELEIETGVNVKWFAIRLKPPGE